MYRSVDGGRTWALAGVNTLVPFGEAMALSPSFLRDRTIVAGGGDGVYRSSDAGETWQRVLFGSRVLSLAAANDAGARETWLLGTDTYGILRSTDDGARWERWLVEPGSGVLPVAVPTSYTGDETVFVGLDNRVLKPVRHAREVRA